MPVDSIELPSDLFRYPKVGLRFGNEDSGREIANDFHGFLDLDRTRYDAFRLGPGIILSVSKLEVVPYQFNAI